MKRFLLALHIIALLSACGPLGLVQEEKDTGNGAGYPGGDGIAVLSADFYFNLRPEDECRFAPAREVFCYKWELDLTVPSRPLLKSRFDEDYAGHPKASHLYYSPHNPDFLGDSGAILVKPRAMPSDERGYPVLIPEAWCQGPGVDGVIISSHDGTIKQGRLVTGAPGEYAAAERIISGTVFTYKFGNMIIEIDKSRTTPETIWRYYGSMTIDEAGTRVDVECALGATSSL